MNSYLKFAAAATIAALSAGSAFGMGHSQGVAEGGEPGEQTGAAATVQSLDGPGLSSIAAGGVRGAVASGAQGENRTTPTRPGR